MPGDFVVLPKDPASQEDRDAAAVARRLIEEYWEDERPIYGPPIPRSMWGPMERMLYDVYAPGLAKLMNHRPLMDWLQRDRT